MTKKNDKSNHVVLVTPQGESIGSCEKLEAHQKGFLHRAFSLMIVRESDKGLEYLLQRRAFDKYHSGGLWSNTCCSHPKLGESALDAVQRRVGEELGIYQRLKTIPLKPILYKAKLERGLTEFEYDHVFFSTDKLEHFEVNSDEISETKWWLQEDIEGHMKTHKTEFTAWFPLVFEKIKLEIEAKKGALNYQRAP